MLSVTMEAAIFIFVTKVISGFSDPGAIAGKSEAAMVVTLAREFHT
jgi:hypothetical protein